METIFSSAIRVSLFSVRSVMNEHLFDTIFRWHGVIATRRRLVLF